MPDAAVDVKWLPFQLNAAASTTGVNKLQMYMQKFNMTKEKVSAMAAGMKQNFAAVGLPYKFSDQGVTGNTFNSHRLIAMAGSKGPAVQDKVVEALFHAYFAEEYFLNDPKVLVAAAMEAGFEKGEAKAFVDDETQYADETRKEMQVGREMQVTGVPFFILSNDKEQVTVSGAQPPERFAQIMQELSV